MDRLNNQNAAHPYFGQTLQPRYENIRKVAQKHLLPFPVVNAVIQSVISGPWIKRCLLSFSS